MPHVDQFSFILGFVVAAISLWALSKVLGWLKSIFRPPSGQPLGKKITTSLRNLIAALLVLLTLGVMGYIVYSVLLK
jgi:multisubunit Na+/H+ antiporter MnhE subunit